MRVFLLCMTVFFFLLSGCTREEDSEGDAARFGAAESETETRETPERGAGRKLGEAAEALRDQDRGAADGQAAERRGADGRAADEGAEVEDGERRRSPGQSSGPARQVPRSRASARELPEDVEIGALEDHLDGPDEVLEVIDRLFAALSEGEVPGDIIAAGAREVLSDRLDYMTDRAEISARVRVGNLVRIAEGSYRASVVAYGPGEGRTTGEIYVAKTDGAWYISDVLVDFTTIDGDAERPIFEPGSGGPTLL